MGGRGGGAGGPPALNWPDLDWCMAGGARDANVCPHEALSQPIIDGLTFNWWRLPSCRT